MTLPLAFDILLSGVRLSLICAVIGLGCAFLLITVILRSSPGNERMRQISGAIQEGAKAYLKRQVMTISMIAVVIFLLLFFFKDHPTAFGFLLGAFCSLAAGLPRQQRKPGSALCELRSMAAQSPACLSSVWRCWQWESFIILRAIWWDRTWLCAVWSGWHWVRV